MDVVNTSPYIDTRFTSISPFRRPNEKKGNQILVVKTPYIEMTTYREHGR